MKSNRIARLRLQLTAAVCAVLALIWVAVVYQIERERGAALRLAIQHGENLASIVADHFATSVEAVDVLLLRLRVQWLVDPRHFAETATAAKDARQDSFTYRLAVMDPQGRVVYADPPTRPILGDIDYFGAHRSKPTDRLLIGNPAKDASGATQIQFTRPILDAAGGFAGVMALSVPAEFLTHAYQSIQIGPQGLLGIRRLDNTVFLRWPDTGAASGSKLQGSANWTMVSGSEIRPGGIDGVERIFSYQRTPLHPFYAVIGQALDAVLADYHEERRLYLGAGAFLSLMVAWFGLALLSKLKSEEQVENALRQSEARFRNLTALASDVYWEQDAEYRFVAASGGAGPAWLSKQLGGSIGKRRWDFHYLNMGEADWAKHRATLDARKPFQDLELCRLDESGRKVWVSVSGQPVFDDAGVFKGYRGIGKDITTRKRDESLLKLEHAVARHVAEAGSASEGLKEVMRSICETEDWDAARYFGWDEAAGVLRFGGAWSRLPAAAIEEFLTRSRALSYVPGTGLIGQTFQDDRPHWVQDTDTDPRVAQKSIGASAGMHGAFFFPVVSRGRAIGVLAFNSCEVREPDERLLQAVKVIGSMLGQFLSRQQGEDDLRRFRTAMNATEDMIWLIDPSRMTILDVNDTACRKLGYTREELLKMGPHEVIAIPREALSTIYTRLIAGEEGSVVESWYHRKDGSRFPVEAYRRVLESNGGEVILAVVRDVTERRAAEEELRRFRLAMDNSADIIVLIDRATMRFVDVNRTACRLLGYSREELLKLGPHDLLPVRRQDLERDYDELIARPTDNTEPLQRGMRSEYTCKDGSRLPFESTRHVLRSGTGYIIAAIARDIRARLAIEEKVAYLAQFDALTNLPNRNLFQDRLAQAMSLAKRSGRAMAVLFIDLDRFKLVNDTQGHSAGDKLLKDAADRLRSCVRVSDTVGRLGGDEFAAILSELGKPADAGLVAQKFIDVFRAPFVLDGKETYVSASVGITLFPDDSESAEELVMNADAAMYRAKDRGRNNYQYFTRDMNERALRRVQTEGALRRALDRSEFKLDYQPKAHLVTGNICGFEALLRWRHPEKGMISPGEFIPILEETGLIVPVGEWVLRTACLQIVEWQKRGLVVPPVAVNLSARQFEQKNLHEAIHQVLESTGVDPTLVEFEITESLLMHDPDGAARTLASLREAGVRLSMDDFGTGYSSLGYLKRFPIDTLKIDRTFVHDITTSADSATLTRAIIHLAQNLRLKVVAEGVETEEQLAFLRANGCDEMQGYLFAKPTGADECERMLREGRKLDMPGALRRAAAQLKRV